MDGEVMAATKGYPPVAAWMETKDGELKAVLAKLVEYESELHRALDQVIEYLDGSGGSVEKAAEDGTPNPTGYPSGWPAQANGIDRVVAELEGHVIRARETTAQRLSNLRNLIVG
jgi:hypothetical protein